MPHLRPSGASSEAQGARAGDLVIETVPLAHNGYTYKYSKIVYIKGRPPAPVILVHPNYAGLKQFDIDVAAFLARSGYVGFALDIYKEEGDYKYSDRNPDQGTTPELIAKARKHFYGAFRAMNKHLRNPKEWRDIMKKYLDTAGHHPAVATGKAAAIGYCFGGQCLLEQVRAGHPLQAVVSFHGLLNSRPTHQDDLLGRKKGRLTKEQFERECGTVENCYSTNCKVLIENGDLDDHVKEADVLEFKTEFDAQGIDWRINNHAQTHHGFALSEGVWSHKYDEDADRRSTLAMLSLFAEVWPEHKQYYVGANACGTKLGQAIVPAQVPPHGQAMVSARL